MAGATPEVAAAPAPFRLANQGDVTQQRSRNGRRRHYGARDPQSLRSRRTRRTALFGREIAIALTDDLRDVKPKHFAVVGGDPAMTGPFAARPAGFEPATSRSGGERSIH